ncbi:IS607 family transposase [Scytonema sp. UIC 10036]|uniref:IS607 family transposase n=1 Tax=Scytonema sp. UIC 10036 TaxID=2304196 RepID=UPI0012DAE4DD|nr:IS607 family transposase [Scytonema sp. UIC 10036]MUG97410.1 IS607 family transposase [Scytonema sp. UIC 10036]
MSNYRPHEFAKLIGKSVSTLRRWDSEGKLPAKRGLGNQRFYDDSDIAKALNLELTSSQSNKAIIYCRVSTNNQKPELETQIKSMETFCLNAGIPIEKVLKEIGGGLNFKRKVFINLMKSIRIGETKHIVVAHKDRLARFGFDFLEEFASWYGCKITVANQESLSPQQEMVEDLMAVIHCFSSRLYGLRRYKKADLKKFIESIDKPT